jgi:hypothetical protein
LRCLTKYEKTARFLFALTFCGCLHSQPPAKPPPTEPPAPPAKITGERILKLSKKHQNNNRYEAFSV